MAIAERLGRPHVVEDIGLIFPPKDMPHHPSLDVFQEFPWLAYIPKDRFPKSVAFIPDGNGRWAAENGVDRVQGHMKGAKALQNTVNFLVEIPYIEQFIVWGASADNWEKRDRNELNGIMSIVGTMLRENEGFFHEHEIRVVHLGGRERIEHEYPELWESIQYTERVTKDYSKKTFGLGLDFGGRDHDQEVRLMQKTVQLARQQPVIPQDDKYFLDLYYETREGGKLFKDPDLVIRTSGEQRPSGFGWPAYYGESYVIQKYLPDLTRHDSAVALWQYAQRDRRLGGRPQQGNTTR